MQCSRPKLHIGCMEKHGRLRTGPITLSMHHLLPRRFLDTWRDRCAGSHTVTGLREHPCLHKPASGFNLTPDPYLAISMLWGVLLAQCTYAFGSRQVCLRSTQPEPIVHVDNVDALAMTIRGDAVLGYMAAPPVTPPELVEQCRCVLPRWKLVGKCQSRSLAALGRRAWEHWPKDHDGKITGLVCGAATWVAWSMVGGCGSSGVWECVAHVGAAMVERPALPPTTGMRRKLACGPSQSVGQAQRPCAASAKAWSSGACAAVLAMHTAGRCQSSTQRVIMRSSCARVTASTPSRTIAQAQRSTVHQKAG